MNADEIHKTAAFESTHWWYVGMQHICLSLLRPHLNTGRRLRILDIGSGTGGNLVALSEFGDAAGVDIDPLCVSYCREKGFACTQGTMSSLDVPPGSLDLVTMFDVITQAPSTEAAGTLRGVYRALAPGGLLAFRDPAMAIAGGVHHHAGGVRFRFSRAEVRALLESTGFEQLRITYMNTLLFPLIVVRRRLQAAMNPTSTESDVQPVSPLLNMALLAVLKAESAILRAIDLPFGVSVFAIARKPL